MRDEDPWDDAVLTRRVRETYGDPRQPHYGFVERAIEADVHHETRTTLAGLLNVEDRTDGTIDVSSRLELRNAADSWQVRLSFVGPYALFFREPPPDPRSKNLLPSVLRTLLLSDQEKKYSKRPKADILTPNRPDLTMIEQQIFEVLQGHGYSIADERHLSRTMPFDPIDDEGPAPLHRVLFYDDPAPPWTETD